MTDRTAQAAHDAEVRAKLQAAYDDGFDANFEDDADAARVAAGGWQSYEPQAADEMTADEITAYRIGLLNAAFGWLGPITLVRHCDYCTALVYQWRDEMYPTEQDAMQARARSAGVA